MIEKLLEYLANNEIVVTIIFPLLIAFLGLIASIISTGYVIKSFIATHRPYVWAISFSYLDKNNIAWSDPRRLLLAVKNSPARIIKQKLLIKLGDKVLYSPEPQYDLVRYPHDKSQWTFDLTDELFQEIKKQAQKEKQTPLRRISEIQYSSLNYTKKYYHKLTQIFNHQNSNWIDEEESGN